MENDPYCYLWYHWIPEPGRGSKVVEVEANYTLTNVW